MSITLIATCVAKKNKKKKHQGSGMIQVTLLILCLSKTATVKVQHQSFHSRRWVTICRHFGTWGLYMESFIL